VAISRMFVTPTIWVGNTLEVPYGEPVPKTNAIVKLATIVKVSPTAAEIIVIPENNGFSIA